MLMQSKRSKSSLGSEEHVSGLSVHVFENAL